MSSSAAASSTSMQTGKAPKGRFANLERIARAPRDEPKVEELNKPDEIKSPQSVKSKDDQYLKDDFDFLESQTVGGMSDPKAPFVLHEGQKAFTVDQLEDESKVRAFNKGLGWLDCVKQGVSYEAPFPGPPSWYPVKPSIMRLEYEQSDFTLRVSNMVNDTLQGAHAWAEMLEKDAFMPSFKDLAKERTDAHALIYKIDIEQMNTTGLPHRCEVGFWSAADDGNVRQWKREAKDRIVGKYGPIGGCVVEPNEEFDAVEPGSTAREIYHADNEHICGPWMSRLLQFNFAKFNREFINGAKHKIEGNTEYIRVKAPEEKSESKNWSPLQWFVLSFYRYLNWATKTAFAVDMVNNEVAFKKTIGESVCQEIRGDEKDAKLEGYQFVIYKPAIEKVAHWAQKKVRASTAIANLDYTALTLDFVGKSDTANKINEKKKYLSSLRDPLEVDPIVGPLSFVAAVHYIAFPGEWDALERQNPVNLGEDITTRAKPRARGTQRPAPRTQGTDVSLLSGRANHSFRHSMKQHNHRNHRGMTSSSLKKMCN